MAILFGESMFSRFQIRVILVLPFVSISSSSSKGFGDFLLVYFLKMRAGFSELSPIAHRICSWTFMLTKICLFELFLLGLHVLSPTLRTFKNWNICYKKFFGRESSSWISKSWKFKIRSIDRTGSIKFGLLLEKKTDIFHMNINIFRRWRWSGSNFIET